MGVERGRQEIGHVDFLGLRLRSASDDPDLGPVELDRGRVGRDEADHLEKFAGPEFVRPLPAGIEAVRGIPYEESVAGIRDDTLHLHENRSTGS